MNLDKVIFIAVSSFFFGFIVDGMITEIVPLRFRRTVTHGIAFLLALAMTVFAVAVVGEGVIQ